MEDNLSVHNMLTVAFRVRIKSATLVTLKLQIFFAFSFKWDITYAAIYYPGG